MIGKVRHARHAVGPPHLLTAVAEERAPFAPEVQVPACFVGRTLKDRLQFLLKKGLQGWPDGAGIEPLWGLRLGQPDTGLILDLVIRNAPSLEDVP